MPDKQDNRDIFEKIFDETGILVPVAMTVGGGVLGGKLARRASKLKFENYHGIKPGDEIYDEALNLRRATQEDADYFERIYKQKVRSDTAGGAIAGVAIGNVAGEPIAMVGTNRKRRK